MSNNIVEENPVAQSSNTPSGPQGQGAGGGQDKVRKQARQLAYDVRYKVKQGFKEGQKTDPASLKQAYLSQLGKSPAPGPVKQLAKKMLVGESYDFVDVNETATQSFTNAVSKVFVKTVEVDDADGNPAFEITDLMVKEESGERKYKIRVTDKKTNKSYTRMATRPKISELRKNPNIASVEMTGYGTPYEGEKKKGEQTAAVKSGKGLAKKDYDGDGKVESPTAEYKGSKDKAIKKALHKEQFIDEVNTEDQNPQANTKRIDVMKGKNKVIINPTQSESKKQKTDNLQEKEVKVKDTYKTVAAIVDYDRAKKGSKYADWDSLHGKKKEAKKERDYAAWERSKMKKDDPNWKHKKYHTGMHGEEVEMEENALTEEFINENIEVATNYFYKAGLNEEGLGLVIEDVGVDDFTDFVLGLSQQLNEEREAKKAPKRDYEKVKAAVYAKDAERKAKGTGEYAKTKAAKEKYGDKPAPEGKPEKKVEVKKKVEKSVAKAKKTQPLKPISKPGLGDRIRGAVKKGVERHKAAVGKAKGEVKKIAKTASDTAKQHAGHRKKFVGGLKATPKERKIASGVGKAVKKAVVGEDAKYGYDKKGRSLNPADVEARRRKDDDLFGSPNPKKKVKESYKDEPPIRDQTDKQLASVTFDGGGPDGGATITGTGDEREIPTFVTLIKNKMRARGILVAHHEPQGEVIAEKDLTAKERRALPDKDFALPGKGEGPEGKQAGSYPIPDKSHARMALAMVAKHGTSAEKAKVRAAVEKKFPGIKVGE